MNGTALNWETASGGLTLNTREATLGASTFETTSSSFVTVTNLSITISNETSGTATMTLSGSWTNNNSGADAYLALFNDGTVIDNSERAKMSFTGVGIAHSYAFQTTDGSDIDVRLKTSGAGTSIMYGNNANYESTLYALELY